MYVLTSYVYEVKLYMLNFGQNRPIFWENSKKWNGHITELSRVCFKNYWHFRIGTLHFLRDNYFVEGKLKYHRFFQEA